MAISSFEETTLTRLARLERAFDEYRAQDKPGSRRYAIGNVPYGTASGMLTGSNDLVFNATNVRLGIGTASPRSALQTVGYGGVRSTYIDNAAGFTLQGLATTNSLFHRGFTGYDAFWNDATSLWEINNFGANDTAGMLVRNGGTIDFIIHPTTGNVARTMTMTDFLAGSRLQIATTGETSVQYTDGSTNTQVDVFNIYRRTSGTPAANFGTHMRWYLDTNGANDRIMSTLQVLLTNATDASRTAEMRMFTHDSVGAKEAIRFGSNGAAAMLGFFGVASVIRQTGGVATAGAAYTATEQGMINRMYTALRNYGLLT